jgi:hypothetical protein
MDAGKPFHRVGGVCMAPHRFSVLVCYMLRNSPNLRDSRKIAKTILSMAGNPGIGDSQPRWRTITLTVWSTVYIYS